MFFMFRAPSPKRLDIMIPFSVVVALGILTSCAMASGYTLAPCDFRGEHGKAYNFNVKARLWDDGNYTWEIRRVFKKVLHNREALDLSKLMRRDLLFWHDGMDALGFDPVAHIFKSWRSCKAARIVVAGSDKNEKEWTSSTDALLFLFQGLAVSRRKLDEQVRTNSIFIAFVAETLTEDFCEHFYKNANTCCPPF